MRAFSLLRGSIPMSQPARQQKIARVYDPSKRCVLLLGDATNLLRTLPDEGIDLVITSPPYFMGKEYDHSGDIRDFINLHRQLLPDLVRVTKPGGNICWQVGYYAKDGTVIPLDFLVYQIFNGFSGLTLRNRIIWTFGHGLHNQRRFSGRHEVILWFSKGEDYYFDLDPVRVPQKYPGKKYYKGAKKGQFSGNPLGKNPSDVWTIPNVKAHHIEKTDHPCQFPVALAQRLIRALAPLNGRVLDPFMGSGSAGVASAVERRKFVGMEAVEEYYKISTSRCTDALNGSIQYRSDDRPILEPDQATAVARKPAHFK
jgi:adenine-specific DNA-methyltransferase